MVPLLTHGMTYGTVLGLWLSVSVNPCCISASILAVSLPVHYNPCAGLYHSVVGGPGAEMSDSA